MNKMEEHSLTTILYHELHTKLAKIKSVRNLYERA